MAMENTFKGKVLVVTGGASGIGAAIAARFGSEGAKIALLDFDEKALGAMIRRLTDLGIEAWGARCDVSRQTDCVRAIKGAVKRFGRIDVLVNNAGITQRSLCSKTDISVYRRVMDVNFFGSVHCTQAALPALAGSRGIIIVTTSIAGIAPLYGRTGYCASKHALHGFFESLRTELRDAGVHVMMVCPYFTKTNLQSRALDGAGRINRSEREIIGSQAEPESVADAVYRGSLERKRLIVLTPMGKLSYVISRFFPAYYERRMEEKIKPEFV